MALVRRRHEEVPRDSITEIVYPAEEAHQKLVQANFEHTVDATEMQRCLQLAGAPFSFRRLRVPYRG
jgi:hypothetical protein